MNESINLCEILKGHEGDMFYSPCWGYIELTKVGNHIIYFDDTFKTNSQGKINDRGECVIFPSKDQRDWNKWIEEQKPKVPKFRIDQLVRSKISGNVYKITDNSDLDNYRFEGTLCPLSEYELEDATPKTWSELVKSNKEYTNYTLNYIDENNEDYYTQVGANSIEKSALALLKIHQLIEVGYGGNVTKEEWDKNYVCFVIRYDTMYKRFVVGRCVSNIHHIAFHSREQVEEFLKYPENVQLLKDYFMV